VAHVKVCIGPMVYRTKDRGLGAPWSQPAEDIDPEATLPTERTIRLLRTLLAEGHF